MTKTENIILNSVKRRVNYFQKNNFDKYVILEYVDGIINKARKSSICTDDLLRHLFDVRQKVVLEKK
ncbi:hypothetical protein [Gemella morbillorum]